jgi:transposase
MEGRKVLGGWTEVLQLADFVVVHHEEDRDRQLMRFTVILKQEVGVCPHCGRASETVHQRRTRERIKDLPLGERAVELRVRVPQLWCEACARLFTPALPALADSAHATERFLERVAAFVRKSDLVSAAALYAVPEKTLEGWYYDYVARRQQVQAAPLEPIRSLGIDELSLKKSTGSLSPS